MHYGRLRRQKNFKPLARPTLEERFWAKVDKSGGCWLWTAALNNRGYGQITINNRRVYAHRLSYEMANGPIPKRLEVLHECDTPNCVNPAHLSLGTHLDNMKDMLSKGRAGWQKGVLPHRKLTDDDVREIKKRIKNGERNGDLARFFGVSPNTISGITHGRNRRHIV